MKPPLFIRALSDAERRTLQSGLRSREAFTLRRAQILLASAEGQRPSAIAGRVGCAIGTVHNAIHAFAGAGVGCLTERKHGPKDARPVLDAAKADPLKGILHQTPRRFGKARSTWTLGLLAEVDFEQKLTPRRLSHEAVRQAVKRLGHGWKRAKHWITSPDSAYARKKSPRPTDPVGPVPPRLGRRVPGRVLVESAGPTRSPRLGRGRTAAVVGTRLRPERSGPEGVGLRRAVAGRHRRNAPAVRVGPAGQPSDRGRPGVGVRAAEGRGEDGGAPGVG